MFPALGSTNLPQEPKLLMVAGYNVSDASGTILDTGETLRRIDMVSSTKLSAITQPSGAAGTVSQMDYSPDGTMLVVGFDNGDFDVYDTSDWSKSTVANPSAVTWIKFSPDSRYIVSCYGGNVIRVHSSSTLAELHAAATGTPATTTGYLSAVFVDDGAGEYNIYALARYGIGQDFVCVVQISTVDYSSSIVMSDSTLDIVSNDVIGMALSTDENYYAFMCQAVADGRNTIQIRALSDHSVVQTWADVGIQTNSEIVFSADSSLLYYQQGGSVYKLNRTSGVRTAVESAPPINNLLSASDTFKPMRLNKDGTRLYVGWVESRLLIIDTATDAAVPYAGFQLPEVTPALALSPYL